MGFEATCWGYDPISRNIEKCTVSWQLSMALWPLRSSNGWVTLNFVPSPSMWKKRYQSCCMHSDICSKSPNLHLNQHQATASSISHLLKITKRRISSSGWLNQPLWKICSSNWESFFPKIIWNPPPIGILKEQGTIHVRSMHQQSSPLRIPQALQALLRGGPRIRWNFNGVN